MIHKTCSIQQKSLCALILLFSFVLQAEKRPNILFFLVDDMGIFDTSEAFYYKDGKEVEGAFRKNYRTPNIEKLADNGRKFTNAYSYSVCSPTRITLMTGQSAPRHKVTTWTHPKSSTAGVGKVQTKSIKSPVWQETGLDLKLPILPELMRKGGYRTLFAGKAHFGPDDTPMGNPINCGFDVSIAGFGGGGPGAYKGENKYSAEWRKGGSQWNVPGLEKYHGTSTYLTEAITIEMNKAIEDSVKMKKPFFSYMSQYAIHAPWLEPDPRFAKNYPKLKGWKLAYATLIEGMDKSLGDMIENLDRLGVAEETLIVFFSDNGAALRYGNEPIRAKKGTRFEGGSRVPMIVSWAKVNPDNPMQKRIKVSSDTIDDRLVTCEDIYPTFLSIAGLKAPKGTIVDGYDISTYFQDSSKTVRPAKFLVHFPHKHANTLFTTFVYKGKKIIYNYGNESWELYDLKADYGEKKNLIKSQPELAMTMAKKMIAELDGMKASYPVDLKTDQPVKPKLDKIFK